MSRLYLCPKQLKVCVPPHRHGRGCRDSWKYFVHWENTKWCGDRKLCGDSSMRIYIVPRPRTPPQQHCNQTRLRYICHPSHMLGLAAWQIEDYHRSGKTEIINQKRHCPMTTVWRQSRTAPVPGGELRPAPALESCGHWTLRTGHLDIPHLLN